MKRLLIITIFLSTLSITVQSQDTSRMTRDFDMFRIKNLQEKLYIHTDRSFYLSGEMLWFKAYCVDGTTHIPLNMSTVAYVEILDNTNTPVLQTKVELENGTGHGSIALPVDLNSGNYLIRAYTRWMKNYNPEFYFHKQITVVNAFRPLPVSSIVENRKPDIQFFPEGGNLINDVESKVAFRGIMPSGKSFNFSGVVTNQTGDTVATFHSARFGMGYFQLTPKPGVVYTAVVRLSDNMTYRYELPNAFNEGVRMSVSEGDEIKVDIVSTPSTTEDLLLFVHCRENIIRTEPLHLSDHHLVFTFSKDELMDGINHFTLFDKNMRPLCERLLFKQPEHALLAKVETGNGNFASRKKVDISLNVVGDEGGEKANLSVSVFLLDSLNKIDGPDINTYMLLTSDLSGKIESPEFYFRKDIPEMRTYIDNLMLTHGWSRFKWEDILNSEKDSIEFSPEYRGQIIEAKIRNKNTGEPASFVSCFLTVQGKTANLSVARSDEQGNLKFDLERYFGDDPLYLVPTDGNDSTYSFELKDPFSALSAANEGDPLEVRTELSESLRQRNIYMQTRNDYFESELAFRPPADSTPFYFNAGKTYILDDYVRFTIMEDVMREYVPEVWVRKRKDGFYYMIYDAKTQTIFKTDPLVLFDGMPVFDVNRIMKIDPLKIRRMETVSRKYIMGPVVRDGIVSYSTYSGDLDGFERTSKEILKTYGGLQAPREFYQPRYDLPSREMDRLPDQRNLLYWNPDVVTDDTGKGNVTFYTSDIGGSYALVIEGLTPDGKPVTGSMVLKTEEKVE